MQNNNIGEIEMHAHDIVGVIGFSFFGLALPYLLAIRAKMPALDVPPFVAALTLNAFLWTSTYFIFG